MLKKRDQPSIYNNKVMLTRKAYNLLLVHKMEDKCGGGKKMAYKYSKGWFILKLKEWGITHHPVKRNKLELNKTYELRNLYNELCKSRGRDK